MRVYSDVLKELRKDRSLTQKDIGTIFGISATTYCLYENGNRKMTPSMLSKLATILCTSTDYILGRTDCSEPYSSSIKNYTYSERLKLIRKKLHLNQKNVGDYLGISATMYCLYENGKRRLTLDMLYILADLFCTSTDYILGRVDKPEGYPPSRRKRS